MNHVRRLTVLVLALLMGLAFLPAAAQDEESAVLDDFSDLEGLEDGVARSWTVDFEALFAEATIDPESTDDPFASMDGVFLLYGSVMKFEDGGNAEDAYEQIYDLDDEEWTADMGEDAEFERDDVDDLGDQAFAITTFSSDESGEGYYRIVFAQEEEYLFFSMAVSLTEDGNESADDLADYLVNEGEESSDAPEFDVAGTSTGGLWGFFPDDDEDFIGDLIPAGDEITFPVQDEDE